MAKPEIIKDMYLQQREKLDKPFSDLTILPGSYGLYNRKETELFDGEAFYGTFYQGAGSTNSQFIIGSKNAGADSSMYFRRALDWDLGDTSTTFSEWQEVAHSGNVSRLLNGLFVKISGDEMTGNLRVSSSSTGTSMFVSTKNGNGEVGLYASTNRGLYDFTKGSWVIARSQDGEKTYVPQWANIGSDIKFVYFDADGKPAATSKTIGSGIKPIYMLGGQITAMSTTVGAADAPIYLNKGELTRLPYRMAATNPSATTAVAYSSLPQTGIWYVNSTDTILGQSDGSLISYVYSSSWETQIYQDFRTGQIALRGKNNGTWQTWRKVIDSINYASFLDDSYVNTSGDTITGNVDLSAAPAAETYIMGKSITGQTGGIHFHKNKNEANYGNAITWANYSDKDSAQAGIYVKTASAYGSKMYLATTDNTTNGAKAAVEIDHKGNIIALRGMFKGTASRVENSLLINGKTYNGSAEVNVGVIATTYGGTGVNSHTANRLVQSNSSGTAIQGGYHYANASTIGVNYTGANAPGYNLYVNGTSYFNGAATMAASVANPNNTHTGVLAVNNTISDPENTYFSSISMFAPNVSAGKHHLFMFGKARSSKDSAYLGFNWSATNSSSNFITLGLYAVDNVLNITGAGTVGIGTTDPAYKLHVTGDVYANGGWVRVSGTKGLYFQSYGGGWYMDETTWIKTYNSKAIYSSNTGQQAIYTAGGFASAQENGPILSTYYNGNWYSSLKTYGNGNLTIDGPGGSVFLAYTSGCTYFSGGTYYIDRSGNFNGNASTATTATYLATVEGTTDSARHVMFAHATDATNQRRLAYDAGFTYNPSSNTLAVVNITSSGTLSVKDITTSGLIKTQGGVYADSYTGALNMNNSNIYGVNSIYTADSADSASEGIHFYRTDTTVDSLWAQSGVLYFTPNRTLGQAGTSQRILHTGVSGGLYYVAGNTSGTAGTWTGTNANIPNLYTGLTIAYKIGIAGGSSATTLNLTTANGASGAKTVRRNDGAMTTHLPVNSVVLLTYDGTYWRWADYSVSNTKNTAGTTNSTAILYLAGGTSQAASPRTYSNSAIKANCTSSGTNEAGSLTATKIYGAIWNDYAEYRIYKDSDKIPYGKVVIENGDDSLSLSTERLQLGGNICSDTFGFAIGETDNAKLPIAVSGRVLAYINEPRDTYKPGEALCTGPNGTVSKMTREEIKEYPDAIIGYVSAVPDYEVWGSGNVKVDGRIWVKIK